MNYLQLCRRLVQEFQGSGAGSNPATVSGQTGDMQMFVDAISESYRDIQKRKRNWRWLWATVAIPITAGQREYTQAQIAALVPTFTRWAHWKPNGFKYYVTSQGVSGERKLPERLYERAYEVDFGSPRTAQRPTSVSVTPDGGLLLSHEPTENGVLTATFYRTAQTLTVDDDEPEMPDDYHMLIVWHAMSDMAVIEAAGEVYERAMIRKSSMFPELMNDQLEPIEAYSTTLVE